MKAALASFFRQESAGGIILMVVVAQAMILANSPLNGAYESFLNTPIQVRVGTLDIDKPALLWINDGLMALFFLLIGLEVKRELFHGSLSSVRKAMLPGIAAIGGMVVPALVYLWFNYDDPTARGGWAIPAATDIAFALGVLALLGSKVPNALKVFLLALAIIDDLLAIIIIALFYSVSLSTTSLMVASAALAVLFAMNRFGVWRLMPYLIVGLVLWVSVLKSGVHATLAGVALAFAIPLGKPDDHSSPSAHLEHTLHPWSTFAILPMFAFANAGVNLSGVGLADLASPVPIGISLGLLLGKPVGVVLFTAIAVLLGLSRLPENIRWVHLVGVGLLCGIGFTMAMFIASLAFAEGLVNYDALSRLGILLGSGISALLGYGILRHSLK